MAAEPNQLQAIIEHVSDGVYLVDKDRRLTYWNPAAAEISGFSAQDVIGSQCSANILTHVDEKGCPMCTGSCPVSHTLEDGQERSAMVYLHHKLGHRVPVQVTVRPLRNESGEITGAVETFRECADILAARAMIKQLKKMGCVDPATGLPTRHIIESRLAERVQEFQRFGWHFGVLMTGIEGLNEIRERHNDQIAGEALRMAAMTVRNALRPMDTAGIWDHETFLAIVANVSTQELLNIAERVRMLVDAAYRSTPQGVVHVTASIGAAGAEANDNPQSIIQKASRSLYESRKRGRNRVTIFRLDESVQGDET